MKVRIFIYFIALFFCSKAEGQQNLIVTKSQIDKLYQDGYIIANDYKNLLSDQLNHNISIFELLSHMSPWKGYEPSFSNEDNKIIQLDQFMNGGLEELKRVNLIQKDLYQALRKDSAYTKINHYTQFYDPVIMALWKGFFSKSENLGQTIDMFVRQNWIEKERGVQLKAQPNLTYKDIIVNVKYFELLSFPNIRMPLASGLQVIRDILPRIDPHLSLDKHLCQIDSSILNSVSYFKIGEKYFDDYDSTEIKLGKSCTLFFALDSFRTECNFFQSGGADTPDSLDLYSNIGSERFSMAINQLLVDAEKENRFSIYNLGNVGPLGYATYNADGLFNLFPQFRLLPEFLPSIYKGNPRQSMALHEQEEQLVLIPNTKDSYNNLNYNIQQTISHSRFAKDSYVIYSSIGWFT